MSNLRVLRPLRELLRAKGADPPRWPPLLQEAVCPWRGQDCGAQSGPNISYSSSRGTGSTANAQHGADAEHGADAQCGADAEYGANAQHEPDAQHAADAADDATNDDGRYDARTNAWDARTSWNAGHFGAADHASSRKAESLTASCGPGSRTGSAAVCARGCSSCEGEGATTFTKPAKERGVGVACMASLRGTMFGLRRCQHS
mmetsp:Transcript_111590/g.266203  ORF Transcript_111590/g.266203 Transcript_111590/m.266203 type:complete len:203 (-) Transcript_111590:670-1278(-)